MDLQWQIKGLTATIHSILTALQCSNSPTPLQNIPMQPPNHQLIMPPTLAPFTACSPSVTPHSTFLFDLSSHWNSLTASSHSRAYQQHLIQPQDRSTLPHDVHMPNSQWQRPSHGPIVMITLNSSQNPPPLPTNTHQPISFHNDLLQQSSHNLRPATPQCWSVCSQPPPMVPYSPNKSQEAHSAAISPFQNYLVCNDPQMALHYLHRTAVIPLHASDSVR